MSSDLFNKMAQIEGRLLQQEFVAPYSGSGTIVTRIDGIVYHFRPVGRNLRPGYFTWKPVDLNTAKTTGTMTEAERNRYLAQFPQLIMVAAAKVDHAWVMVPWNLEDSTRRFGISGPVEVRLCGDVERFDTIAVAVTPALLMAQVAPSPSPPWPFFLKRATLNPNFNHHNPEIPGLTPEGRIVIDISFKRDEELRKSLEDNRIRQALGFAGAELISYTEQDSTNYVVRWRKSDIDYRTVVRKQDLEVVSAGICLSGRDRIFDLASMVSVMDERRRRWGDEHMESFSLW